MRPCRLIGSDHVFIFPTCQHALYRTPARRGEQRQVQKLLSNLYPDNHAHGAFTNLAWESWEGVMSVASSCSANLAEYLSVRVEAEGNYYNSLAC